VVAGSFGAGQRFDGLDLTPLQPLSPGSRENHGADQRSVQLCGGRRRRIRGLDDHCALATPRMRTIGRSLGQSQID
jgi:hypothetical protein